MVSLHIPVFCVCVWGGDGCHCGGGDGCHCGGGGERRVPLAAQRRVCFSDICLLKYVFPKLTWISIPAQEILFGINLVHHLKSDKCAYHPIIVYIYRVVATGEIHCGMSASCCLPCWQKYLKNIQFISTTIK